MVLKNGSYTSLSAIKRITSGNFREISTESKRFDYEIICKNQSPLESSNLPLLLLSTIDIYNKIVEVLTENSFVERIFIIRENNTFCIWTALSKYDKETRYSLYNKELEIIRYFSPVEFHFDFHLAEKDDIEGLLASGAKIIYTKN